uniref:hyaluronidase-1-like n=1 Tax=Podarcis muralis TaxID=64176 RepID=UPI00109F3EEA|nr:hyaluronidase-1-like [Podarcis muralis]
MLVMVVDGKEIMHARTPLFARKPFVVLWNAPTRLCQLRYKVDLDLRTFKIHANPNDDLSGSTVTIFYHNLLGYYPYLKSPAKPINGGIPQRGNLYKHIAKVKSDLKKAIPTNQFQGLGVIDWVDWKPQWMRNVGTRNMYKIWSLEPIRKENPHWSSFRIRSAAKQAFEKAGETFMKNTLIEAKRMRPKGLWGYYLYPECHNYNFMAHPDKYTGKCEKLDLKLNDRLLWLWKESTALYPSVYLQHRLQSSRNSQRFVRYRVMEAMRVATMARKDYALPVFVYSRPFYARTFSPLTEEDLVNTIGESAALGAAGVVLWGNHRYALSKESCVQLKSYVSGPLGRYIINVTSAATFCSKTLCNMNGRCVRRNSESDAYLHLPSHRYKIVFDNSDARKVLVKGYLRQKDRKTLKSSFICHCYQGWKGSACKWPSSSKG